MESTELLPLTKLDQLNAGRFAELQRQLACVTEENARKFMESVTRAITEEVSFQDAKSSEKIERTVSFLTNVTRESVSSLRFFGLFSCGEYFVATSQPFQAVKVWNGLLPYANALGDQQISRRLHNALGVAHTDVANYPQAMEHFEQALLLARALEDRFLESASLANATRVLKQMGLYHDAIAVGERILDMAIDTRQGRDVRFQMCGIGLFCAHRLHDHKAALRFLTEGGALLDANISPFNRAAFEANRAHYLIDAKDFETAEVVLHAAQRDLAGVQNPRIKLALAVPAALCQWATRDRAKVEASRIALKEVYRESKATLINFDDVLRALMKVHSNAETPEIALIGMGYAKELVEYNTNHRRAKFYRQLTEQGVFMENRLAKPFDPFANSKYWLSADPVPTPPRDPNGPAVAIHEELNAIHEDLAHLRTEAFRVEIKTLAYATAENWALAAEFFDDNTGQHCFRVGYLAGMLAREMNLDPQFAVQIEHAARLHDIGKIAVNEMILLKPGRLDPQELASMRQHAQAGADMLDGTKDPTLQLAMVVARYHHEWWNGTGYPIQLSFDTIPLPARITALADVFDALTNERPYKTAWSAKQAIDEMTRFSGVQFDPNLVPAFLRVIEKYLPFLAANAIPGMADLSSNHLLQSRKSLMETINANRVLPE